MIAEGPDGRVRFAPMNTPASTLTDAAPGVPAIDSHPLRERQRVQAMDVIRGVALLGILVVNMDFFAATLSEVFDTEVAGRLGGLDRAAWVVVQSLFMGKFISLFSFLFGAGIALQAARLDVQIGVSKTSWLLVRRLLLLGAFGLVHATLIWYGDILFAYASMGWTLILIRFLSTRTIAVLAGIAVGLAVLCATAFAFLLALSASAIAADDQASAMPTVPDGPTSMALFNELLAATQGSSIHPGWVPFEAATYRYGPWPVACALRTFQWASSLPAIYIGYGAHLLSMFLLGTLAARTGLLRSTAERVQRTLMLTALPIGVLFSSLVPAMLASGWKQSDPLISGLGSVNQIGTVLLALGYAAALARLAYAGPPAVAAFLANNGRMAFTVYLSMSVLMTGLFYWWGFGLFGQVGHAARFGIALVTWFLLAAFAQLWLRSFVMGPLEWLWRAGTYLEIPALRRRAGADSEAAG